MPVRGRGTGTGGDTPLRGPGPRGSCTAPGSSASCRPAGSPVSGTSPPGQHCEWCGVRYEGKLHVNSYPYRWNLWWVKSVLRGCMHTNIIITQKAAIALEPLTTHPDEWAEPSHK